MFTEYEYQPEESTQVPIRQQSQPLPISNEPPGAITNSHPEPQLNWFTQIPLKYLTIGGMGAVAAISISSWVLSVSPQSKQSINRGIDPAIAQLIRLEEETRLECEKRLLHYDHRIPPGRVGLNQALLLRTAGEKSQQLETMVANSKLFPREQMIGDREVDKFIATERSKAATLNKIVTPALGSGAVGELNVIDPKTKKVIANITLDSNEIALVGLNRVQILDLSLTRAPSNFSTATNDLAACQQELVGDRINRLSAQTGIANDEIAEVLRRQVAATGRAK